jgi:uncharacterized protein (DUF849 family)
MAGAAERLAHVEELRPEICTLGCGTMNRAADGDSVIVNLPRCCGGSRSSASGRS